MKKLRQVLTILLAVALIVSVTGNSGAIALAAEGDSASVAAESVEPAAAKEKEDAAEGAASESGKEEEAQTEAGAKEEKEAADQSEEEKKEPEKGEEKSEQSTAEKDSEQLDYEAVKKVKALFEALPKAEDVSKMTEAELESAVKDTEQALDAFEALGEKESDYFQTEEAELYQAVTVELCEALAKVADDGVAPMSLLPLREEKAYLVVGDHDGLDISAIPLQIILKCLLDTHGNNIEIDPDAKVVWTYFKDSEGKVIQDEYHEIGRNDTVDLSLFEENDKYKMELIIGSGKQLDQSCVRYLVTVYLSDQVQDLIRYELYAQDEDGTRHKVEPKTTLFRYTGDSELLKFIESTTGCSDSTQRGVIVPGHKKGTEYYLGIKSDIAEHPFIDVEVVTFTEYFKYKLYQKIGVDYEYKTITDQILNQDMRKENAGYKKTWDKPQISSEAVGIDNTLFIVYKLASTGEVSAVQSVTYYVDDDGRYFEEEAFENSSGKMENIVLDTTTTMVESVSGFDDFESHIVFLKKGYDIDSEYYFALNIHDPAWEEGNTHVVKAVVGLYSSLEEAKDQEDIKDQLLPTDKTKVPYGYKANYNAADGGVKFTVFFDDGTYQKVLVLFAPYEGYENVVKYEKFSNLPIVGAQDPWFRVTGVQDENGKALDAYVVENGKTINMDTMYGYGYQTIFINDSVDKIKPVFSLANSEEVKVSKIYINGGKEFKQGDTIDCSKQETNVTFHVTIKDSNGEHTKNYNVSFVKKYSGPKLYVTDPKGEKDEDPVRSVFLDEYFEYKHDIFIANLGDQELTGLRVELDATNCKLDDYWTVGGEKNDTLAPFTTTSTDATKYGELANIAKIRLRPDGEGDVQGTLKIYADGQEPITIKLSGRAQNPKITTTSLDSAVKYVPYSYLIATNNMYDWTSVKFTQTGDLPEGLTFIESTGEIYGVPQETGTFNFSVTAEFTSETYSFEPSTADFTLTVDDNTNGNVYNETDSGYSILNAVGTDLGGHDYVLEDYGDEVFRSEGVLDQFVDLWLNGEKLEKDVDYKAESGSTRITIYRQTFQKKAKDGRNTLAAEFRTTDTANKNTSDNKNPLKRTAQNFRIVKNTEKPTPNPNNPNNPNQNPNQNSNQNRPGNRPQQTGTNSVQNNGNLATDSNHVTCVAYVVDRNGTAVPGLALELHSKPQYATTSASGFASFYNVEYGAHTLYVKGEKGQITTQFNLVAGNALAKNGNTITVPRGTAFTLKMEYDGTSLSLVSIQSGNLAGTGNPKTGDAAAPRVWMALLFIAFVGCIAVCKCMKKSEDN